MKEYLNKICKSHNEAIDTAKNIFKDNVSVFIYKIQTSCCDEQNYVVTTNKDSIIYDADSKVQLIMQYLSESDRINYIINNLIFEIKNYFNITHGEKAVIGISGGKDSSVAAALCVRALGKENVIGVLMPNGTQKDISDSKKICEFLDIKNYTVNISSTYNSLISEITTKKISEFYQNNHELSDQALLNLAPRLRMTTLYAISQSIDGARVINTTNACEAFVGYGTLWGDIVGDYAPLKYLTVDEILEIGDSLGLPKELVHKTPSDGLTGKSDEEVLGVSYKDVGEFYKAYFQNGFKYCIINSDKFQMSKESFEKIKNLYLKNKFKSCMIEIPGPHSSLFRIES